MNVDLKKIFQMKMPEKSKKFELSFFFEFQILIFDDF